MKAFSERNEMLDLLERLKATLRNLDFILRQQRARKSKKSAKNAEAGVMILAEIYLLVT